jgi:hypothetical protein
VVREERPGPRSVDPDAEMHVGEHRGPEARLAHPLIDDFEEPIGRSLERSELELLVSGWESMLRVECRRWRL